MILAAGLGTRLRPHTLIRPKPLFPLLDRPLLLRIIAGLRRAGFGPLLVNAFHLREQISACLAGEPELRVQLEEKELGTGGGLRRAMAALGAGPVLVINGDIVHNIDYLRVYEHHRAAGNDATLVLHNYPRFNNVLVDRAGNIRAFGDKLGSDPNFSVLAFTGIQVINPELLHLIPPDTFYNSIDWYRQLIAAGYRVRAWLAKDHYWTDMGTPRDYLALHQALLQGRGPLIPQFFATAEPGLLAGNNAGDQVGDQAGGGGPVVFRGSGVAVGRGAVFADWVVVGSGAVLAEDVSLARCVVWDGVRVPAGTRARDQIFSH